MSDKSCCVTDCKEAPRYYLEATERQAALTRSQSRYSCKTHVAEVLMELTHGHPRSFASIIELPE